MAKANTLATLQADHGARVARQRPRTRFLSNRVPLCHSCLPGRRGRPAREQLAMTQNRNRKRAVRAAQEQSGTSYTTAMRTFDANIHGLDPFKVQFMSRLDGSAVQATFGTQDAPVTWLGGRVGSGVTCVAAQAVAAFLAQPGKRRVIWIDPLGYGTDRLVGADIKASRLRQVAFLSPTEPATARALTALADHRGDGTPTLVVLSDLSEVTTSTEHRSMEFLTALYALVQREPACMVRFLVAGYQTQPGGPTIGPDGERNLGHSSDPAIPRLSDVYASGGRLGLALGTTPVERTAMAVWATLASRSRDNTIWAGASTPDSWMASFARYRMPPEAAETMIGYGWVTVGGQEPVPVTFALPTGQIPRV